MKEHELLQAIQNADEKYFLEAENRAERIERKKSHSKIVRSICIGTVSVAAVCCLVLGGTALLRQTEIPIAFESSDSVESSDASSTVVIAPSVWNGVNYFGGNGALHYSRNAVWAVDDDNIYLHFSQKGALHGAACTKFKTVTPVCLFDNVGKMFCMDDKLYCSYTNGDIMMLDDAGERHPFFTFDWTRFETEFPFDVNQDNVQVTTSAIPMEDGRFFMQADIEAISQNGTATKWNYEWIYDTAEPQIWKPLYLGFTNYAEENPTAITETQECKVSGNLIYHSVRNQDGFVASITCTEADALGGKIPMAGYDLENSDVHCIQWTAVQNQLYLVMEENGRGYVNCIDINTDTDVFAPSFQIENIPAIPYIEDDGKLYSARCSYNRWRLYEIDLIAKEHQEYTLKSNKQENCTLEEADDGLFLVKQDDSNTYYLYDIMGERPRSRVYTDDPVAAGFPEYQDAE